MGNKNGNTEKIEVALRQQLERQLKYGLSQGMYAACKVIYDKAMNQEATAEDRIKDIIAFCEPLLCTKDDVAGA